jgi:cytochrome P450
MLHELQILSLEIAATSLFSMEASTFGSELREMVSKYMDTVGRLYPTDVLLPDGVPTLLRARRALFRRRWIRLIRSIIEVRGEALHVGAPRDLFNLLREAHGSDREGLLADEVSTMIVAGHEQSMKTSTKLRSIPALGRISKTLIIAGGAMALAPTAQGRPSPNISPSP